MNEQPAGAFLERLRAEVGRLVERPAAVLLAVSGGCDSVALLCGWAELGGERGDRLVVAHFDHCLRSDSGRDAQFVAALAARLGLEFHLGRSEGRERSEAAARQRRYAFLAKSAAENGCRKVAVAHTADDQVETVLQAILRGTGLAGLSGMAAVRRLDAQTQLVRPMLTIPRSLGEAYLAGRGQDYCLDESNRDLYYTRNRVRHELLPLLRARFNPRVDGALARLAQIARGAAARLQREARQLYADAVLEDSARHVVLRRATLLAAGRFLACETLRLVFELKHWPRRRMGMAEFHRILDLIERQAPAALDLPNGVRAVLVRAPVEALRLERAERGMREPTGCNP